MPRTLLDKYMREAAAAIARQNKTLGERIREAREARGWKQKELAARVSVEPMTVSRWERGVNQPDIDTLRVLAQATQTPLSFFVEEREVTASNEERLTRLEGQVAGVRDDLSEQLQLLREIRQALALPPIPRASTRQ